MNAAGVAREARAKDPIFEGDKIVTKNAQTVKLTLRENSELVLGPDTSFVIEKFKSGRVQNTVINLFYGIVRSLVRKVYQDNETFAVKTPTSVMGVRGTHFVVEVKRDTQESVLHTLHGTVAVARNLQTLKNTAAQATLVVLVKAGQMSGMRPGMSKADSPSVFDRTQFREQLRKVAPEFDRNVGSDAPDTSGANSSRTSATQAQSNRRGSDAESELERRRFEKHDGSDGHGKKGEKGEDGGSKSTITNNNNAPTSLDVNNGTPTGGKGTGAPTGGGGKSTQTQQQSDSADSQTTAAAANAPTLGPAGSNMPGTLAGSAATIGKVAPISRMTPVRGMTPLVPIARPSPIPIKIPTTKLNTLNR
ncbi:MAG: FecR domain-containing protein [Deltaproteobacteria bacterium]|nr:FecR domain-containing protein [Deltaproteobacteria bacterium]